ncbi:hypothetical protein GCM10011415_02480 [Salipiger pallidus]|uniref:Uncharacterized protein n=1 Tax=Salipiger pallidus TaxID=1775170 RepID=A0A8J2ZGG8_9RHOB|nr:hypothetical protein GCM10011415_02480 [Salipiger pallidus]
MRPFIMLPLAGLAVTLVRAYDKAQGLVANEIGSTSSLSGFCSMALAAVAPLGDRVG